MGKNKFIQLSIVLLGFSFVVGACGDKAPAGNGQITIDIIGGNTDIHSPLVDGTKIHFSNLVVPENSAILTFNFSIDAEGISSQDGTDFNGGMLTLRISQNSTQSYDLLIAQNGVALATHQFSGFDKNSPASFEILYGEIVVLRGQFRYESN